MPGQSIDAAKGYPCQLIVWVNNGIEAGSANSPRKMASLAAS